MLESLGELVNKVYNLICFLSHLQKFLFPSLFLPSDFSSFHIHFPRQSISVLSKAFLTLINKCHL